MIDIDRAQEIYGILADKPRGEWISIPEVRDEARTAGIGRDEFDGLIIGMVKLLIIDIAPEDNQKTLGPADDYNGVKIPGGEVQHLIKIA